MVTTAAAERLILDGAHREQTVNALKRCLSTIIDLALQLKQAHWNLMHLWMVQSQEITP